LRHPACLADGVGVESFVGAIELTFLSGVARWVPALDGLEFTARAAGELHRFFVSNDLLTQVVGREERLDPATAFDAFFCNEPFWRRLATEAFATRDRSARHIHLQLPEQSAAAPPRQPWTMGVPESAIPRHDGNPHTSSERGSREVYSPKSPSRRLPFRI
jgi:hypothetical protein